MTNKTTLEDAERLAGEWQAMRDDADEQAAMAARFADATPLELVEIWRTARNERGKRLSRFEVAALVEAWVRVFGCLPPSQPGEKRHDEERYDDELADDTMLGVREVTRLTGVSKSTIKRMVADERFPRPMKLSERRIGWPARDVKAFFDGLAQRRSA